jgi:transposase-like protein
MEAECVMERRKFTREFKLEAVKLVTERGDAAAQAARTLVSVQTCCGLG